MLPKNKSKNLPIDRIHAILYHGSKIYKDNLYKAIEESVEYQAYKKERDSIEYSDDFDEMCKQVDEATRHYQELMNS